MVAGNLVIVTTLNGGRLQVLTLIETVQSIIVQQQDNMSSCLDGMSAYHRHIIEGKGSERSSNQLRQRHTLEHVNKCAVILVQLLI